MADRARLTVWMAPHELRAVEERAEQAGVAAGAVARLAIIRGFHQVCRDVEDGRIRLRRANGAER